MLALLYFLFIFDIVPKGTMLYFIISLCCYISAKKANRREPGRYNDYQIWARKLHLTASSVLVLFLLSIFFDVVLVDTGAISIPFF
jgi:hypothetical protein